MGSISGPKQQRWQQAAAAAAVSDDAQQAVHGLLSALLAQDSELSSCRPPCLLLVTGTCTGKSQFPCKSSLPSDDCGGSSQPTQINVGGIGQAQGSGAVSQEAAARAASFGRADLAAARIANVKTAQKGQQCGDKNGKWNDHKCENSECKKKDGSTWVCM